jgi:DNA mismatch endonuclease (patch repair protein)
VKSLIQVAPSDARSRIMRAIKGRNTKPEWVVRRLLWEAGYRYRLHGRGLPGTPDLVFSAKRIALFVHGCFWHHHECQAGRVPKNNTEFWQAKLNRNQHRDITNRASLQQQGWKVIVVWECELAHGTELLLRELKKQLGPPRTSTQSGHPQRRAPKTDRA